MKNFRSENQRRISKSLALPLLLFLLAVGALCYGIGHFIKVSNEQEYFLMQSSLKKAIIQCYANEGFFPNDLSYLEDNYGLHINDTRYYVYYECFGANIMPEFEIYEK